MQTLHFEEYLKKHEDGQYLLDLLIKQRPWQKQPDETVPSKEEIEVLKGYTNFICYTKDGKHGKTVKFWLGYAEMVHDYHTFARSIRLGDLELFIAMLPKITNYFFALNHPNYARWTVRCHDNLLRLHKTHPNVFE